MLQTNQDYHICITDMISIYNLLNITVSNQYWYNVTSLFWIYSLFLFIYLFFIYSWDFLTVRIMETHSRPFSYRQNYTMILQHAYKEFSFILYILFVQVLHLYCDADLEEVLFSSHPLNRKGHTTI